MTEPPPSLGSYAATPALGPAGQLRWPTQIPLNHAPQPPWEIHPPEPSLEPGIARKLAPVDASEGGAAFQRSFSVPEQDQTPPRPETPSRPLGRPGPGVLAGAAIAGLLLVVAPLAMSALQRPETVATVPVAAGEGLQANGPASGAGGGSGDEGGSESGNSEGGGSGGDSDPGYVPEPLPQDGEAPAGGGQGDGDANAGGAPSETGSEQTDAPEQGDGSDGDSDGDGDADAGGAPGETGSEQTEAPEQGDGSDGSDADSDSNDGEQDGDGSNAGGDSGAEGDGSDDAPGNDAPEGDASEGSEGSGGQHDPRAAGESSDPSPDDDDEPAGGSPSEPSEERSFTALAGPGCPSTPDATYGTEGRGDDPNADGWAIRDDGYALDGCDGNYDAVPVSGTTEHGDGGFAFWSFTPGFADAQCDVFVYVPEDESPEWVTDREAMYQIFPGPEPSGDSEATFGVSQAEAKGGWVKATGFVSPTEEFTVQLTNIGEDALADQDDKTSHVAASAVRAECS